MEGGGEEQFFFLGRFEASSRLEDQVTWSSFEGWVVVLFSIPFSFGWGIGGGACLCYNLRIIRVCFRAATRSSAASGASASAGVACDVLAASGWDLEVVGSRGGDIF